MIINYELILDKILSELLPSTIKGVEKGNKIFGALILSKEDYSTITIGTNKEIENPLFHGEISAINNFFTNKLSYDPQNCFFISSHEPCSLCLSAITWSGFDNFIFLFPYEKTKSLFKIPHDLKILEEVFQIKNGNYKRKNYYWKSYSIMKEVSNFSKKKQALLNNKIVKITKIYKNLSIFYQKNKTISNIPLN